MNPERQQTKAQSLSTTLSTAKDHGPWTGVTVTISYFGVTLSNGWGRRARAAAPGSRTLVDGLIESVHGGID